jgi:hypothetical protein
MKGNYYLLIPTGEVRVPDVGDWYLDPYGEPTEMFMSMKDEIAKGTLGADERFPILQMKKFDHDPFERIKEAYEAVKPWTRDGMINGYNLIEFKMWQAISETVKELEGK